MLSQRKGGRGQRPYLSEEAQQEVSREVSTGRFRTAEEVRDWIAAKYSVSYKRSGVYGLLYRLRCSPKVSRPVHARADTREQDSWKKHVPDSDRVGGLSGRSERPV